MPPTQHTHRLLTVSSDRLFRQFAWVLFGLLFIYLLLKAFFNEPIQDELATFSYYVQSGRPHNPDIPLDANNHLLNTYFCNGVYPITGGIPFFWMRLPNLLAFALFFYSIYGLTKRLRTPALRYTALAALTMISFLTEYFTYCRGYGLSMAFLAYALLLLMRFLADERDTFGPGLIAILLATGANLSLMPLCLFIAGCFVLASLVRRRKSGRHVLLMRITPTLLFLSGLAYLLVYAFRLKANDALYWGGNGGLWDVTGTSLTVAVLFFTDAIVQYTIIALLALFVLHIGYRIYRERAHALRRMDVIIPALLLGMLVFLELGNRFLGLLYPLDRGGLHLVLLFLLALVFLLDSWKAGKLLHWALLCFPVLFIVHMHLHGSPTRYQDSIPDKLYARLQPLLTKDKAVLCNTHVAGSYAYQCLQNGLFRLAFAEQKLPTHSDLWITRRDLITSVPEGYCAAAGDSLSGVMIYRRKQPAKRIRKVAESPKPQTLRQLTSANIYDLVPRFRCAMGPGESIELVIDGRFVSPPTHSNLQLIASAWDADGQATFYSTGQLRMHFQDRKIDEDFHINLKLDGLSGREKEFVVYFWSPSGERLVIHGERYRAYLIK